MGDQGEGWVSCLEGVLFAHRTAKHASTGFSPFRILYGREPKLPIDVKYELGSSESVEEFDDNYVKHVVDVMSHIREAVDDDASIAIARAQQRQKEEYDKKHGGTMMYKPGDKVLLKNLKRADRKGGKSSMPWLGPYTIVEIVGHNVCTLSSDKGPLKTKQNLCNIKIFQEPSAHKCSALHKTTNQQGVIQEDLIAQGVEQQDADKQDHQETHPDDKPDLSSTWISNLKLPNEDKSIIEGGRELTDKIIDAAQTLLRAQFISVDGLDTTLLSQTASGFTYSAHQ